MMAAGFLLALSEVCRSALPASYGRADQGLILAAALAYQPLPLKRGNLPLKDFHARSRLH